MNFLAAAPAFDGEPFTPYGADHRLVLTLIVLFEVLVVHRYLRADAAERARLRKLLAAGLIAQEISYHVWRVATRTWSVHEMLPLHLCSWSVWLGAAMLWTRSVRLYDYLYYAGTVGAGLAMLMPDLAEYGPRHYRFWQFFVSHGLIITAPVLMTFGEGFRPSRGSVGRAIASTFAASTGAFVANLALDANYMFLRRKPPTPSVLDKMPPWPGYLPIMVGGIAAVYGALYLPWGVLRRVR